MSRPRKQEQASLEVEVTCTVCKKPHVLKVPTAGYRRWLNGHVTIQDAMPGISQDSVDLLVFSICSKCFDYILSDD